MACNGNLFFMGDKARGISGQNNDNVRYSSPIQIPGTWSEAWDVGKDGPILAIKTNGTLWGWGGNYRGALGQNDTVNRSSPVQVGSDTNWVQAQMGNVGETYAIKQL